MDHRPDPLAGLPGRGELDRFLRAATTPLTVLAVDIDDFRRVNVEAGHRIGDRVLAQVADILHGLTGPRGLAVRLAGDDFVLLVPALGLSATHHLAELVQHQVSRPVDIAGIRLHLRANVGVVLGHRDQPDPDPDRFDATVEELLSCSDVTLALAQTSPNGMATHTLEDCRTVAPEALLHKVAELHGALAPSGDQLGVHLQPQYQLLTPVSADNVVVVGCEALVRWRHPTHGLLGASTVLRVAGVARLRRALSERVLDMALAAAATWWAHTPCPVSVNLDTDDLDDDFLPALVAATLSRHGLPAGALTVEVVEDSLMANPDRATRALRALRDMGVRTALDDFGTGYSSLAWLHKLPIDTVKFDRSIINGIATDPAATAIVRHSIRLAHDLGLDVLAEGVECHADLVLLQELGCTKVQGYLTGRPMPVSDWAVLLGGRGDGADTPSASLGEARAAQRRPIAVLTPDVSRGCTPSADSADRA